MISRRLISLAVAGLISATLIGTVDAAETAAAKPVSKAPTVWMFTPPWPDGRLFRELFQKPDGWKETRSKIDGVGYWATHLDEFFSDKDLRSWFGQMNAWKLKLALEVRVIKQETPVGMDYYRTLSKQMKRFRSLGAKVYSAGMDEPFYCGRHILCKPDEYAVQQTADFIEAFRKEFPGVRIGDIEPYPVMPLDQLKSWINALEAELAKRGVRGMDFFRVDVDWCSMDAGYPGSWGEMVDLEKYCRSRGMDFSMIYWASDQPRLVEKGLVSDMTWYSSIMYQGGAYALAGGSPDEYVVESWIQVPTKSTPETSPVTFTGSVRDFVRTFVKSKAK